MFGWKNKRLALQIEELDRRLEHNSKIIEEDHHDLVELRAMSTATKTLIGALQTKIELLESRQKQLREGFKAVVDVPQQTPEEVDILPSLLPITPPLAFPGIPIVDHVCVDSDFISTGNSDICIYCHPDLKNND